MPNETVAGTTADPTIKFTPLKLGKKTYQLCYDFEAVAKAEALTGMELLIGVDWSHVSVMRARAMLYACALKAHPDIKVDEFSPYLRHRYIQQIQSALFEAWTESVPEDEGSENPQ